MIARKRAPYLGPQVRRPLVVEEAAKAFADAGYAATSMADIAKQAGVAKAVLYDCFPEGKIALFRAAIRRSSRAFRRVVTEQLAVTNRTLLETLHAMFSVFRIYADRDPAGAKLLFRAPGTPNADVVEEVELARSYAFEYFTGSVYQGLSVAGVGNGRRDGLALTITAVAQELARRKAEDGTFDSGRAAREIVELLVHGSQEQDGT